MKSFSVLAGLMLLSAEVSGHYIFNQLTVGGTKYAVQQYIRPNSNYNSPIIDLTSNDLRCNQGGESGAGTDTLKVAAGSSVTWASDIPVYHDGPIAVYMANAGASASAFDGSGNVWFKIWQKGPTFNPVTWPLSQTYTFTLPAGLPNGNYLLRIEQLGIHNPYPGGIPQFYTECAQITITNGGSGSPGPLVAIPGYVKGTEQGYTVNIYNSFTAYTFLGPSVWSGGGGGSPATTTKAGATTTTGPTTKQATTTTGQTTKKTTTTTAAGNGATVPKYGQCGGTGWTGGTVCAAGSICTVSNQYYSQCL